MLFSGSPSAVTATYSPNQPSRNAATEMRHRVREAAPSPELLVVRLGEEVEAGQEAAEERDLAVEDSGDDVVHDLSAVRRPSSPMSTLIAIANRR